MTREQVYIDVDSEFGGYEGKVYYPKTPEGRLKIFKNYGYDGNFLKKKKYSREYVLDEILANQEEPEPEEIYNCIDVVDKDELDKEYHEAKSA